MCTVTWLRTPGGYHLLSNRDERRSRGEALPPRVSTLDGVRYVAPRDGDFGGTWILVNELGVALCLLNRYDAPLTPGREYVSRGALMTSLAGAASRDTALAALGRRSLGEYRPFTLVVADPLRPVRVVEWDGRRLTDRGDDPPQPLSSSSFDGPGAEGSRRRLLAAEASARGGLTPERLLAFHRSHHPERGPLSPCMHRPDARTVSFSWVAVEADRVTLTYAAGPPCATPLGEPVILGRRIAEEP